MAVRGGVLERWNLFLVITIPIYALVVLKMSSMDLSSAADISAMIQFSVRTSVPWLYMAFAASSAAIVFPGEPSRWLLRNRRYIGLCFAAAMAWQLVFIVWFVAVHWDYYLENAYAFVDIAVQIPGYVILTLMTVTSFRPGRDKLSARQWRILHKTGIYFLWGTVYSTYWNELYYYDDIQRIDHFYYWAGFAAVGVRMLAWSRKRWRATAAGGGARTRLPLVLPGIAVAIVGLLGIAFAPRWSPPVVEFVWSLGAVAPALDLAVPFLPILMLASGAWLLARARTTMSTRATPAGGPGA
jgi:hypothetical protein